MKRMFITLLVLLLALSSLAASADLYPGAQAWTIYQLDNGAVGDYDSDGDEEVFSFAVSADEDNWDGSFSLAVGDQIVVQENCCELAGEVYIIHIGWKGNLEGYYATLFMVPEYGPSDDPYTYCYLYEDGQLIDVGGIPALPGNMSIDAATGTITTSIRADMVGTWYRPADYILAQGSSWDDETFESYHHLAEVPRPIYPFGMIVSLKQELPLMACQTDRIFSATLAAGQQVILAATDDVRWLYVTSMDGLTAGWVKMGRVDWETKITVGDVEMNEYDVFDHVHYAD